MALPYDLTIQINEAHVDALKTCDLLKDTIDMIDKITTTLEDGKGYVRGGIGYHVEAYGNRSDSYENCRRNYAGRGSCSIFHTETHDSYCESI